MQGDEIRLHFERSSCNDNSGDYDAGLIVKYRIAAFFRSIHLLFVGRLGVKFYQYI